MAFLRAIALNGLTLFALGVLHVPLTLVTFAIVALASTIIAFVTRGRVPAPKPPIAATILLITPFVIALIVSAVVPLADYDGLVTWLPKAKAIAREASITGPFFRGERGLNLHNHYPLLMPLNAAAPMRLLGTTDDWAVRWLYILVPFAALLAARDLMGERGAWICAGLAWLPQFVMPEGGMLSAYSDLAVAAFFGMAVLTLMRPAPSGIAAGENAGLWLAALVVTKNEGIVLALAAIVAAAICRRLRWRDVLPPLAALVLLIAWRLQIPEAYDERYSVLIRGVAADLHRIDDALIALLAAAFDVRAWGLFWIATLLCIRRRTLLPAIAIAIAVFAYTLALTVTSWDIAELAKVSANRLWLQLIIPSGAILDGWLQSRK